MPREKKTFLVLFAALALVLLGGVYLLYNAASLTRAPETTKSVVTTSTPRAQEGSTAPPDAPAKHAAPPQVPAPPPDAHGLRGSVRNVDGSPAAGAEVWAYSTSLPRDFATAISDDAGRFALPKLQYNTYDLVATLGDDCAVEQGIPADMDLNMQLARRGQIFVVTKDEAGLPVDGATLTLELPTADNDVPPVAEILGRANSDITKDAQGTYTIHVGVPGNYVVHASTLAGQAGTAAFQWQPPSEGEFLTIRVTAGVTVSGTVVNGQGQPIEGAELMLGVSRTDTAEGIMSALMAAPTGTTDASGSFSIERVPRGTYTLDAHADGYADTILPDFEVTSLPIQGYRVVIQSGGTIQGLCFKNGAPADGIILNLKGAVEMGLGARSAEDGSFAIHHVPEGRYALTPYARDRAGGLQLRTRMLDVLDGQTTEVNIDLTGAAVAGSVSGIPEDKMAVVRLVELGSELPPTFGTDATKDPDTMSKIVAQTYVLRGAFQLGDVPPGTYTLEIFVFEFTPASPDDITLGADAETPSIRQTVTVGESPVHLELAIP